MVTAVTSLTNIWKNRGISKATKIRIMKSLVFPIAIYGCETWAVGKADHKRVASFEMWCWRRMLRISWTEHKTNTFVLEQIDTPDRLCDTIDRIKLKYFGHVSRREGDNLEKIIVQGRVEGTRKRGRQKLRWADGLRDRTGLSMNTLTRLAQNRQTWHNFIIRVTDGQS